MNPDTQCFLFYANVSKIPLEIRLFSGKKDTFTKCFTVGIVQQLKIRTVMDTQSFFTPEERKEFLSKYRLLLRSIQFSLQKDDIRKMRMLIQRMVSMDCYGRDRNGINGL